MIHHRILLYRLSALLLGVLLVSGCTPVSEPSAQAKPSAPLVWPPAPSAARVRFVRSFTSPQDLGIGKSFLEQLGELFSGPSEVRLVLPMAVVSTRDGTLYVADPGVRGVHRFDVGDSRYQLIRGENDQPLPSPVGLAVGAAGEVYVTDSSLGAVFLIEPGATEATRVPLQGLLAQPTGIALDPPSGRLYVVDTGSHKVKIYARDGALLGSFGRRGEAPGKFNFPTMIWRQANGNLLITDALNFRIQVFDAQGRYLRTFGEQGEGSGSHARPKGVASDSYGHVYVVDALFHALQVFDADGAFLLNVGVQGQGPGEFWLPAGIYIDENEMIYVADSQNRRVQVFKYIGGKQ